MVTASHNPKRDDGYKVYWGNGAQIIAPVDKGIAAAIADPANQAPWAACRDAYVAGDEAALRSGSGLVVDRTEELMASYVATVTSSQSVTQQAAAAAAGAAAAAVHAPAFPVKMAYTAMHGVGTPFAQVSGCGFAGMQLGRLAGSLFHALGAVFSVREYARHPVLTIPSSIVVLHSTSPHFSPLPHRRCSRPSVCRRCT
jgi:hypothetical protein